VTAAGAQGPVDVVLVLDLLDVAVSSGAALPRAVEAVGRAVGGPDGDTLTAAARALVLGAGWSGAWAAAPPHLAPVVACLADSWGAGAAPGPRLRAAADEVNRARRRAAREAAGRLGVRLVLPLGLCLLPAFVLLGLVPVVLSLAGGLLG
jgi:pilus assembly protein TadC